MVKIRKKWMINPVERVHSKRKKDMSRQKTKSNLRKSIED